MAQVLNERVNERVNRLLKIQEVAEILAMLGFVVACYSTPGSIRRSCRSGLGTRITLRLDLYSHSVPGQQERAASKLEAMLG